MSYIVILMSFQTIYSINYENTKFLSILKVLQPLNAEKQLVLLSKLKSPIIA
jgi:hypothetical protein